MELLLTVLGAVAVTAVMVIAGLAWAVRAVVRRVRRAVANVTPAPGRVLRIRAMAPGPSRAVAVVRRDLHDDMAAAARAVQLGLAAGRPVDGLVPVSRRLAQAASDLDVDLAVIAAEPDAGVRAALLDQERDRLATFRGACAELRRGVQLAGGVSGAPLLASAVADLGDEVTRLGLWAQAHQQLSRPAGR